MIVMKFGGTSVQDAMAMQNVLSIAQSFSNQSMLIVSSACSGITSELLSIASDSVFLNDKDRMQRIDRIIDRHLNICDDLHLNVDIKQHIIDIGAHLHAYCEGIALLGECTDRSLDAISSCGELFSTRILAGLICKHQKAQWFDARSSMKTDSNHLKAQVNIEETTLLSHQLLKPLFEHHDIVITQGFIGSDEQGITTTLGRGGSDYSAAMFGAVLEADDIIIWTDVSGIASADPRVIPDAKYIESMSFDEARMLSFFGAKVLHPETILPAMEKDIPVHVRNTFKSQDIGTTITRLGDDSSHGMRSVIARMPVSFIQIQASQDGMNPSLIEDLERLTGLKPLIATMIDASLGFIYDIGIEKIEEYIHHMDPMLHSEIREYALISAIGPDFRHSSSKDAIRVFHEIIQSIEDSPIFISGVQKNIMSALVQSNNAHEILKELHVHCE